MYFFYHCLHREFINMRKQNLISDEGFSRLEIWYTRLLEDLCNEGNDGTESGVTKIFILAVAQFI